MEPAYKIEVYNSTPTLIHTIEKAKIFLKGKETLTNNIGTFSFALPTKKNGDKYYYNDIVVNDKVKIWFGWSTVSGDPFTVGKIYRIVGHGPSGYRRLFFGRNQGEILQRRLKAMKDWNAVGASTIVTELANDLGLGTGEIEADATAVTMRIDIDRYETYFSVLKAISDYWFNAGSQIKKDFYVDVNNNLVWKSRPIRTTGVETLTAGENVSIYELTRDLESMKNKIYVYGTRLKANPSDRDSITESTTPSVGAWSVTPNSDTVDTDSGNYMKGTVSIRGNKVNTSRNWMRLIFTWSGGNEVNANHYPSLNFHIHFDSIFRGHRFDLQLVDTSAVHASRYDLHFPDSDNWNTVNLPCGRDNEDRWHIPAGSSFDWENIEKIYFAPYCANVGDTGSFRVDALFFNSRNFYGMAENVASQTAYGLREMFHLDTELPSDDDCSKRAETLLYQLKDIPIRIDTQIKGNTNVLIGDRLPMTIPAENISAVDYDVVSVEHIINAQQGFITNAVMLNSANVRSPPATNLRQMLIDKFNIQKDIGKGISLVR